VVAVKEAEHRPLMPERFAQWEHRLDYWNIDDVEYAAPAEALKLLAQEVRTLLQRFRGSQAGGSCSDVLRRQSEHVQIWDSPWNALQDSPERENSPYPWSS
jgi:hypothetical protein